MSIQLISGIQGQPIFCSSDFVVTKFNAMMIFVFAFSNELLIKINKMRGNFSSQPNVKILPIANKLMTFQVKKSMSSDKLITSLVIKI